MSDNSTGRSRFEEARAKARAMADDRAARRAGRQATLQTASAVTVSSLWLIQTYIVRALCVIAFVGGLFEAVTAHVGMPALVACVVAAVIFAVETLFAQMLSANIRRETADKTPLS